MVLTHRRWRFLLLATAMLAAGCGWNSHPQPADVPVTGTVTLDGRPLTGAIVTFDTDEPAVRAILVGVTDEAGKFRMQTATPKIRAFSGLYRVFISKMLKPDGSPVGPDEIPAAVLAQESLPLHYSSPSETKLAETVPEGGADFEFKLSGR